MAKRICEMTNYAEFIKVCKFVACNREFPEWIGEEKYILFTDVPKEELDKRFHEILEALSPFVIMSFTMKREVERFNYNEEKHLQLMSECECLENIAGQVSSSESVEKMVLEALAPSRISASLLKGLSKKQRRRLLLRHIENRTIEEIAHLEGTSMAAISQSIHSAEKKMKKNWQKP